MSYHYSGRAIDMSMVRGVEVHEAFASYSSYARKSIPFWGASRTVTELLPDPMGPGWRPEVVTLGFWCSGAVAPYVFDFDALDFRVRTRSPGDPEPESLPDVWIPGSRRPLRPREVWRLMKLVFRYEVAKAMERPLTRERWVEPDQHSAHTHLADARGVIQVKGLTG